MEKGFEEQPNIEGEKPIMDRLEEHKEKEEKAMDDDRTYFSQWKHIVPKDLTEEAQKVYEAYINDKVNLASVEFKTAQEKLEEIKNKKVKDSNEKFLSWIDGEIDQMRSKKVSEEQRQKDN